MRHFLTHSRKAFTIVELMVAILVFTIGLLSAYMLVDTAMSAAINGRNEIIATNLAREQIELFKNLRDTNWLQNREFLSTGSTNLGRANLVLEPSDMSSIGPGYYTIENRNGQPETISLKKLSGLTWSQGTEPANVTQVQLCEDDGVYTHDCSGDKKTPFYSFIQLEPLNKGEETGMAYRLTSIVLTRQRGYREYIVRTIITDWKR